MQNQISQNLKAYFGILKAQKKRNGIAGFVTVLLLALTFYFMQGAGVKRMGIAVFLCMATGLLLALPVWKKAYLLVPVYAVYFLYVPKKIFERMELPSHDMSRIQPGVYFATIMVILFLYAVLLLILQKVHWALGVGNILLCGFFLVNYYVREFRGTGVSVNDLLAVSTAFTVMKSYRLSVAAEQWYSILYFLFFIAWGFWCKLPFKGKGYHLAVTGISVGAIVLFAYFWKGSGYLEKYDFHGTYWNMSENQLLNGSLLGLGISLDELSMDRPLNYSTQKVLKILEEAEKNAPVSANETVQKPDIILIMNEAWSDLRVLGNLETTEEYMPFTYELMNRENVGSGNLSVEVLGGLTANTEFEVLTGDALAFLSPSAIPYQLQVNHEMKALPGALKKLGYQTMAMHPSGRNAWDRDRVYAYFDFDVFVDQADFETEFSYVRAFPSDACNFNEIIWRYEHRQKTQPFFLFDVTIQNHGDYYGDLELPIEITKIGNMDAAEAGYSYDAQTYLNLIRQTDDAFRDLISYFEKVDTPTIICMFGDHQPHLGEDFYRAVFDGAGLSEEEMNDRKYVTPYVIWANYEIDLSEVEDISANYLGAVLMRTADLPLPNYYRFLLDAKKQYPVITFRNIAQIRNEEKISDYRILQYHHLMEKKQEAKLFAIP